MTWFGFGRTWIGLDWLDLDLEVSWGRCLYRGKLSREGLGYEHGRIWI